MCLDVYGAGKEMGTNIHLYPWSGNYAQMWSVAKTEWGYVFKSRCNSFTLDIQGGLMNSGNNVQVWEWNGSKAQLFDITPFTSTNFKGNGTAASPYQIRACSHKNSIQNHSRHDDSKKNNIKFIITGANFAKTL